MATGSWRDAIPDVLAYLRENPDAGYIAAATALGLTEMTCRQAHLFAQGVLAAEGGSEALEPQYERDVRKQQHQELYRRYQSLQREYNRAVEQAALVERLVAEAHALAPKSYEPHMHKPLVPLAASNTPETYVLQLSDAHVGKEVAPDQTLGFGGYSFSVFLDRLAQLERAIISLYQNHTVSPIDRMVIAFQGDIVDGGLTHGVEAGQEHTVFTQFFAAGHAFAQFFRNLASYMPLDIYTVVGNHGRLPHQKKMPTKNRYSNFDMFLYAYIEALTKAVPNIAWHINHQPFQLVEVQNHIFHIAHGDHWRGGDKAFGVPLHAMGRQVSATTSLYHKAGKSAPNYYVTGHLHRGIQIPHTLGDILVNGGFPGVDDYSLRDNFTAIDPMQRLHRVHPRYGISATHSLKLHFADPGMGVAHYELPPNLLMV